MSEVIASDTLVVGGLRDIILGYIKKLIEDGISKIDFKKIFEEMLKAVKVSLIKFVEELEGLVDTTDWGNLKDIIAPVLKAILSELKKILMGGSVIG